MNITSIREFNVTRLMACGFSMFFLFWQMFLFQVLHPVWLNVIHFFIIRIILSCILLSLLLLLYLWLYFKDDYIIVFFPFPWLFFCKISILILMQGCYNFLLKFSQHFCLYIYIYIIFQHRSIANISNSSKQVLAFCCPQHINFRHTYHCWYR